jgi:hypothetical protein
MYHVSDTYDEVLKGAILYPRVTILAQLDTVCKEK